MSKPLKISTLTKDYGSDNQQIRAVDNVSFEVEAGEIFGLLGPNGAGKTTIISTITTLEKPTLGTVEVFGTSVVADPKRAKCFLGVVPQELVNQGFFSVEEILNIYSGYHGIWRNQEHVEYLLEKLSLKDYRDRSVKALSGGMKRRLMIAKALVHKPKLLLLDEPTAGVDVELRQSLWEFVRELKSQGITILLTTHYLEEAEMLCDRVGIIHKGKLVRLGPTKELVKDLTNRQVHIQLAKKIPPVTYRGLVSQTDTDLFFEIPSRSKVGDLLLASQIDLASIQDIQITEGSLEQAFHHVVGKANE